MKMRHTEDHLVVLARLQKIQLEKDAAEAAKQAAEGRARALEEKLRVHSADDSSVWAQLEMAKQEIADLKARETPVVSLADLCDVPARAGTCKRSRTDDGASMRSSHSTFPPSFVKQNTMSWVKR
jgi:hypothetical protein